MVVVNYRNKKYAKYISVYIKIKIVKTSKYNLSYMRYYIVIAIRELILIFCENKNQFYISQIGIIVAKRTYTNKCLNIQHKLSNETRICKPSAKLISCRTYVQIKKNHAHYP